MAYSNQTTNYGLPLPNGTDKSTWLDTNEAFQTVDTALAAAVAKGDNNEAAIGTLAQRVTAAETNIASDGADIDALETRMTANEQVAANALTGVAQLSEKVYDYEERAFTSAAEAFAFINSLSEDSQMQLIVKKVETSGGTKKRVMVGPTANNEEIALNAFTWSEFLRLEEISTERIWFTGSYTENTISSTYMLQITNSAFTFYRHYNDINFDAKVLLGDYDICSVSSITLRVPVAVAED